MGMHSFECVSYTWMSSYKEMPRVSGSKLINLSKSLGLFPFGKLNIYTVVWG